jgi:hypothetical protein
MLTLFTAPKPFRGHVGVIQRNAIRSWTLLRPACKIILLGNEEGIAEVASDHGVRHIADVARTASGTPLVNDLFQRAEESSDTSLFCYANCDIVLMSDFMQAVRRVAARKDRFLLIGHRWNLDVTDTLAFTPDWVDTLKRRIKLDGTLAGPTSIDFFVYPRGVLGEIPPFAIGRPRWDNWMLHRARSLRMPLIDATAVVTAVHQNHDYSHHPQGHQGTRLGDDALTNARLAGDLSQMFSIGDATHLLTPDTLRFTSDPTHLLRHCETLPFLYPWGPLKWLAQALSMSRAVRAQFGLTLSGLRKLGN